MIIIQGNKRGGGWGVFGVLKYYQNFSCGALVPLGADLTHVWV